ncbi:hypothetical protein K438DRAFT_1963903 [Mycena galopus ATCC 62051]|nr:hypothetical protein K438DRAFT_1963903 [Mycena galopus ATCC 62051]
MLSCLAVAEEGQETDRSVRYLEPYTDDAYYFGSSTNWALCVDTSPARKSETPTSSGTASHVDKMRLAAESTEERVVAIVYFLPCEFAFDGDAVRTPVGKVLIIACKATYRGRNGGDNIMNGLLVMVNARAHATGCAFMLALGTPTYYRAQGYEYALYMGRGLITHFPPLAPSKNAPPSLFTLRPATLDDLPALERLTGPPPTPHPLTPWTPFFVLEKRDMLDAPPRVVAAAAVRTPKPGASTAVVNPLLWDVVEDASAVAQAIARALVGAVRAPPTTDGSPNKVTSLRWTPPDAHPLYRWLLTHELAVPTLESSRYEFASARMGRWIAIPSRARFLTAPTPALNVRLAGSKYIFGANYTASLHIAAPRTMGGGVVLRVADGTISMAPADTKQDPKPNLSLPRGALVQLLMGYLSWRELKAVFPDVAVEPAVVPLPFASAWAQFDIALGAVSLPWKIFSLGSLVAEQEGQETDGSVRYLEPYTDDAYDFGSSCAFSFDGLYLTLTYEYAFHMGRRLVTHFPPPVPSTDAPPSLFTLRPATLNDLPALERLLIAPRANAGIFIGVDSQLRYLLTRDTLDAPPRVVATAAVRTPNLDAPTAVVNPLLWDGVEDASAVAQAIARSRRRGGSPARNCRLAELSHEPAMDTKPYLKVAGIKHSLHCFLPSPELLELILADFDPTADKDSLQSIALTATPFTRPVQRIVFRSLALRGDENYAWRPSRATFERMVNLLNGSSHLAIYVKDLTIKLHSRPSADHHHQLARIL